jgi:hypothetical protein
MVKLSQPPKPEEQIQPEKLARVIKSEKPGDGERLKDISVTPENYKKFKGEQRNNVPRTIIWAVVGLAILFVGGFVISFYVIKEQVKKTISAQVITLQAGVADLQNFDPQAAQQQFSLLGSSSTPSLGVVLGIFGSLFQSGQGAIAAFTDLAKQLALLSEEAGSLESGVIDFANVANATSTVNATGTPSGNGTDLVTSLTNIRDTLTAIDTDTNSLSGTIGHADLYLPLKSKIEGAETFLNEFIPWLASSTPHHVLVLLQNPSEIRPGGGFLGSYADITIASGTIANITVRDVADVDVGFTPKIIPPKPLQLEVNNFRPADANWFFDFPTSASETIDFFQESKLYAASSTTFDGAIAVSPAIVSDLLSITGPLKIGTTTFTADNFLVQIQNIVQQGQAQHMLGQATYPKAVLEALSQQLFQNIASSTPAQKQQLLSVALDWISKKDVMAYFKDPDFENFLMNYGAAGDVYQLPQAFNGDYLAIVDANIRGDKSDLYVSQKVTLDTEINADGTITDDLTIDRTHNGNQSPYWWYQTTNQDYLQLFVPDGASLTNETGGIQKTVPPPINYARSGYSTDPLVEAIESSIQSLFIYPAVTTHEESGKEVFATWSRVAKGQSTTLEFDYTHRAFLPPVAGTQYQFVFEKQAGTSRSYDWEIDAPLGYVFAENGIASYEYISDDPPGRLIINLTLQKI